MRLLAVEFRRLFQRRLVRFLGVLLALGMVIAGVLVFANGPEDFGLHSYDNVFGGTTAPIALAAWVVGASFVGAEWHAGTMAATLTWEPRRLRLLLAKAAAVILFTFVGTIVVQAVLGLVLAPAALRFEPGGFTCVGCGPEESWFSSAAVIVLRGATVSAVLAALGFGLASIGRNTAASVGVGFGYLLVVEGLLAALVDWLRPVLITPNAIIFVSGTPIGDVGLDSPGAAGMLLGLYGVAAVLAALVLFRTRDVT
jgi:hypothetical protein